MRDSEVANAPLLLPFAQCRQVRVDIDKVMDLHQIDAFCSKPRHRTFHRLDPTLFAVRPNFGCEKKLFLNSKRGCEITDHLLGASIHRRRINHASVKFYEQR